MDVLIKNLGLPTEDEQVNITILSDGSVIEHFRTEKGRWTSYRSGGVTAIELPPHGRLVSADEVQNKMSYYGFRAIDMTIHEFIEDELTTIVEASNGFDN